MCIGIPMKVEHLEAEGWAICRPRDGAAAERIDLRLVETLAPGTWVLTFMGAAREIMTEAEAARVSDAIAAIALIQQGRSIDHLFADLIGREPQLPEHLRK